MISVFIEKRHSEVVSLHEVVQNFKIKKCQWLKGNNNLEILKCTEMLYELIWWIFECLVIPLLKLNFYITNHAKQGNRLSYYRREIWFKMVEQNLKSLTSSVYEKIPSKNEETIFKNRKLGYSELKFLPKDNKGNLRPIVNMKCPMRTSNNIKRPKSINSILNTTFQILKYEKEKNPSLLTGSIFNYNEVHACLKEYKKHLSNDDNPRLYFAKVDIKCCFETIDQNILMEIIKKEVLTEYQYSVNKFEAIYLKGGTIYRKRDNFVHDSSEFLSFPKYSAKLTQNYKNAILIDNVYESYMEVEDVLELLKEHIQQNIIKVNEEYYKQKVGIPQGSVLSSLLCSIYYGVMEREEFKYIINDTNGLLLHFLDDFLYISTNKNNVIKFITTMHQDDLKYKIVVNDKKSMVNFDLTVNNNKINKVDGYEFLWCGILIDTRNLDVKVDYSRYSDLSHIANILTIKSTKTPGTCLKKKMIEILLAKSHKIFYDTSLNTRETTLLNIYQNFLMAGMKFHHCIKGMPRQKSQRNEDFEFEVLHNAIDHLYLVLCKTDASSRYSFNINKKEFMWLGANAFYYILNKKQSYHKGVLSHFKKFLENSQLDNLNHIVDCKLSLIFNKITF
ncbi:unnamed protein product [Rhizophagus irregularis]|nr:unnamed protein product [Rhizophagus irregularis]